MTQTSNGEPMSIERALSTIQKLEGLEIGLYQRTEGITWMLWGFITAGIYFMFSTFGAAMEDDLPDWLGFLWAPWVAAGIAATMAIWRSAHLASGAQFQARAMRGYSLIYLVTYFVLFFLAFFLLHTYGSTWNLKEPGVVMIVLGVASTLVAHLTTSSAPARSMLRIVGALALVAALVLALVPYSVPWHAYAYQTFAGVIILGGGWFLGGLYLTLKG